MTIIDDIVTLVTDIITFNYNNILNDIYIIAEHIFNYILDIILNGIVYILTFIWDLISNIPVVSELVKFIFSIIDILYYFIINVFNPWTLLTYIITIGNIYVVLSIDRKQMLENYGKYYHSVGKITLSFFTTMFNIVIDLLKLIADTFWRIIGLL